MPEGRLGGCLLGGQSVVLTRASTVASVSEREREDGSDDPQCHFHVSVGVIAADEGGRRSWSGSCCR